jgi:hypothetical protein
MNYFFYSQQGNDRKSSNNLMTWRLGDDARWERVNRIATLFSVGHLVEDSWLQFSHSLQDFLAIDGYRRAGLRLTGFDWTPEIGRRGSVPTRTSANRGHSQQPRFWEDQEIGWKQQHIALPRCWLKLYKKTIDNNADTKNIHIHSSLQSLIRFLFPKRLENLKK